jgi:hypothetical protein
LSDQAAFESRRCVYRQPVPDGGSGHGDQYFYLLATRERVDDQAFDARTRALSLVAAAVLVEPGFQATVGKAHIDHHFLDGECVHARIGRSNRAKFDRALAIEHPFTQKPETSLKQLLRGLLASLLPLLRSLF